MRDVSLRSIVNYCQDFLHVEDFQDYDDALNGLQLENSGKVHKIVAAVDASINIVQKAKDAGATLLIVHHGIFWGGLKPWTDKRYEMIKNLIENNIALYSSHLPLDAHPIIGNNAILCNLLGIKDIEPAFTCKGQQIGFKGNLEIDRDELCHLLSQKLNAPCKLVPQGKQKCSRIGVVSGGGGGEIIDAFKERIDTFITGEGAHWTWTTAQELRMNVIYGGHYNTEQFGIQALAEEISNKFGIPWSFLDDPSGL